MTNEEKFRPEWGFEAGVVVEVTSNDNLKVVGFYRELLPGIVEEPSLQFIRDEAPPMLSLCTFDPSDLSKEKDYFRAFRQSIPADHIKSIRILSGPFSVWADYIPGWAESHHQFIQNDRRVSQSWWGLLELLTLEAAVELGAKGIVENGSYIITRRPWWAKGESK